MDELDSRIILLHKQVALANGGNVDLYYYEGYGALAVPAGYPLIANYIIFAFPDEAIKFGAESH